jgi:parallel beta-helix repeat protein
MFKTTVRIAILLTVLTMILTMNSFAASNVVQVNTNGQSCLHNKVPVYTTIQAAVDAVATGGTVLVCPGTYPEQVTISQPLTLRGVQSRNMGAAVVVPPATGLKKLPGTSTAPQIFVHAVTTGPVTLDNMTVDASNNLITDCTLLLEGVYFYDASGTVKNVAARNQSSAVGGSACNGGFGIRVVGIASSVDVTIQNNSVRAYDSAGILAQAAGSPTSVTIQKNSVSGPGSISNIATRGIWMLDGATGPVSGNSVVDNSGLSAGGSEGILIQGSHGVQIVGNTLGNNAYGIKFIPDPNLDADDGTVSQNTVLGSGIDGIYVCSNNNLVQANRISASLESGVNLASLSGTCSGNNNTISNNSINEACAGILVDPGVTGNVTTPNLIFNATTLQLIGTNCTSGSEASLHPTPHAIAGGLSGRIMF